MRSPLPEPKKRFTPEFRDEAVRLVQTSGRSRREVAADLRIGLSTPHLLCGYSYLSQNKDYVT